MLWWAAVLMFIGATGFNISNIALVLLGDVPLDLSTSQEVRALTYQFSAETKRVFAWFICNTQVHLFDFL